MKIFKKASCLIVAACTAFTAIGCSGNGGGGDANTLDIFATNAGYGVEWITDMVEGFKNSSWVKEKYPNLTVNFGPGDYDNVSSIGNKVTAGSEKANKYDLLFTCNACGDSFGTSAAKTFFEDLDDVYSGAIPGESAYDGTEGKQLKDKMKDSYLKAQVTKMPNDDNEYYYSFPWLMGTTGIVYNKTKLTKYMPSYELPRTSDELLAMLDELAVSMSEDKDSPWVMLNGGDYCGGICTVWWAQYDGAESYDRYFKGVNEAGEYSAENFSQTGRLRSLQLLEKIYSGNHVHEDSYLGIKQFMKIQNKYLRGLDGIFMFQGDWFENENKDTKTQQEFDWLKVPVMSEITEKCDDKEMTDEQLSYVVALVDENKAYSDASEDYGAKFGKSLTESDYDRIYEARNLELLFHGHQAHIPNYASGKEIAKDFLRFMASDEGIRIMMSNGRGYVTAFNYDMNETEYAALSTAQKTRHENAKTSIALAPANAYYLYNYGGLTTWKTIHPETVLTAELEREHKTADQIIADEVEYYTKDNAANFKNILRLAGLA